MWNKAPQVFSASPVDAQGQGERLLRMKEVQKRTGYGRASIYSKMASGVFPRSVSLAGRAVAWVGSELDAWIAERIKSRGPSHASAAATRITTLSEPAA